MNDAKYIGLDVHQATISATVLDSTGKLVMESILETKTGTILGSAPSDNCGATAAWPWRPATVEVILDNRRAPVLNAVALAAFAARAVPLA
jgi:hypothetical protein